ncbi:MAG: hypothetical protein HYS18_15705 [Burkholderiales bacterium]|nr:hypothetical protein [Burkholderiales bacterium]
MTKVKHWIEYASDWRNEPMAYWVHAQKSDEAWHAAREYEPPVPQAVAHKGFPVVCVEIESFIFRFSSVEQLAECVSVLSLVPLPTTRSLSRQRDGGAGPNSHWLSRLPAKIKAPKARLKAVAVLNEVLQAQLASRKA